MTNILNEWKGIGLTEKDASKNEQSIIAYYYRR